MYFESSNLIVNRLVDQNKAWQLLQIFKSISDYSTKLTSFLAYIYRTLAIDSGYHFILNTAQMEAAKVLWTHLQRDNNITSLIHNLVYALIGEPISGTDTSVKNHFNGRIDQSQITQATKTRVRKLVYCQNIS